MGLENERNNLNQDQRSLSAKNQQLQDQIIKLNEARQKMENEIQSLLETKKLKEGLEVQMKLKTQENSEAQTKITELQSRAAELVFCSNRSLQLENQIKQLTSDKENLLQVNKQIQELLTLYNQNSAVSSQYSALQSQYQES